MEELERGERQSYSWGKVGCLLALEGDGRPCSRVCLKEFFKLCFLKRRTLVYFISERRRGPQTSRDLG